jgi:uncharacterized protein YndB with AHSA1/START domain
MIINQLIATTMKASDQTTNHKDIVITHSFTVPLQNVWKAWTDPAVFKTWWGPKNYTCPHVEIDFKVGGKILSCMRSKDGKEMWGLNVFQEIEEGRNIVMTDNFCDSKGNIIPPNDVMPGNWADELIITLEFDENLGKTDFTLKHEGIPPEMYDDCKKGWEESFDKMEEALKD